MATPKKKPVTRAKPVKRAKRASRKPVLVDFALQGGGAHGAFAWGVLDRALEEPRMQIEGISGTSAGAMNAAVLADGYTEGGADGARAALERFWKRVSDAAAMSPFRRGPLDVLMGRWTLDTSPTFIAMDLASRLFSPYDLGIAALNPLRDILAANIDFDRLRSSPINVYVTATNVRTGRGRVFRNAELSPEALARLRAARSGPASNFWRGGVSTERESIGRWTTQVAGKVHEANGWTCQLCHRRASELHCRR